MQIQFSTGGEYRTGDYWLIPARVATGSVEWPQADELNPQPLPPRGIEHHYALLGAVVRLQEQVNVENLRCEFWPLFFCADQPAVQTRNALRAGLLFTKPGADVGINAPAKSSRGKKQAVKKLRSTPK